MNRKIFLLVMMAVMAGGVFAQPATGYYEGTDGLQSEELKAKLNEIISGHVVFSYSYSKYIFRQSDVDPNNSDNVIMVYTGRSHPNNDYGTGGDQLNREHVWAKSHGGFDGDQPMDGDVHNLKPADASVNSDKGNKDFDWGGEYHPEATECKWTTQTWEPRDAVKGDIARIIFYMSTRYEGHDGELDLEVVDAINTYPLPEHGKLSALLEWNNQDPPDEFEMNRNNVIESYQQNRNPFIDNPEWANIIWAGHSPNPIAFTELYLVPAEPVPAEPVDVFVKINSEAEAIQSAVLYYGTSWDQLVNSEEMDGSDEDFEGSIPGYAEGETVYYRIEATDGTNTHSTPVYSYYIPKPFSGTLTSIYDIQGQAASSPYDGQVVNTSGVVTANFGSNYYIQDGYGDWNGLFIYDQGRNPNIGDSVILTGTVAEYYGKTELTTITDYYFIAGGKPLPAPKLVATGDAGEAQESVLIRIENAVCTDENFPANYGMWTVDDGSGELLVHNTNLYEYVPSEGESYNVTGPLNYDFDEWKIELRFEADVEGSEDLTKPEIATVEAVTSTVIKVTYSEAVEESSAESLDNYSINNDIIIEEAKQHTLIKSQVFLTVGELSGGDYELTVENVKDLNNNVMDKVTVPFSFVGIVEPVFEGGIDIHPVPVKNNARINFFSLRDTEITLELYSASGHLLETINHSATYGNNSFALPFATRSAGMYIVRILAGGDMLTKRIIKQ